MDAKQLKEILQVLKDFDVGAVKLKTNDFDIELGFNRSVVAPTAKKQNFNFPEAKHITATMSDITADELAVLGMAGVNPSMKQPMTEEQLKERIVSNLSKNKSS